MGKTSFATKIARSRSHEAHEELRRGEGFQGGVFMGSLEMAAPELGMRMLAAEAGVNYESMQAGELGSAEMGRLIEARRRLKPLPMMIDDAPNQTIGMLAASARAASRRFGGLSLVIIDHATIVRPDERAERSNSPAFMFSRISNAIQRLAKELDVPVIVLVQLNREVEKRENKRPQKNDLTWSGSFEQDASIIILLHREWYYLEQEGPPKRGDESETSYAPKLARYEQNLRDSEHKLEAILAKLRRGKTRTLELYFDGEHNDIRGMEHHYG